MAGILIFIYALLCYLHSNAVNLSLGFASNEKMDTDTYR